jgi:predicted transcriptional regulator YdeE
VTFSVVERQETLVAGTVLRSPAMAIEGVRRQRVQQAWHEMLKRELPGPTGTAYIDYLPEMDSYQTHVLGYQCKTIDDLQPGDVLARVPGGTFALFTATGGNLGDVVAGLWQSIWEAEERGKITRTYTGDFEHYPKRDTVEVFVAISQENQ